jgi:hypothetical protein
MSKHRDAQWTTISKFSSKYNALRIVSCCLCLFSLGASAALFSTVTADPLSQNSGVPCVVFVSHTFAVALFPTKLCRITALAVEISFLRLFSMNY